MKKTNKTIYSLSIITFMIILIAPLLIESSFENRSIKSMELQIGESEVNSHEELTTNLIEENEIIPFSGFVQYQSQGFEERTLYSYSANGISVTFKTSEVSFFLEDGETNEPEEFSLNFLGSEIVAPVGVEKTGHPTYYFNGKDQADILTSWNEIWYYDLYPGIDLRYHMTGEGLKYDFIVHPGSNPGLIAVKVSDSVELDIEEMRVSYKLNTQNSKETIADTGLKVFQNDGTKISAKFSPVKNSVNSYSFSLGAYNPSKTLIIDPLFIQYSTFLGGTQDESGYAIVVDSSGNSYITGTTKSLNFPTLNAYNDTSDGTTILNDAFVAKLNAAGNELEFSTYIGGDMTDFGIAIAIDEERNIYIGGQTGSDNFPIKNAYDSTFNGAAYDTFVLKLNNTGNGLEFSTFYGGGDTDVLAKMVRDTQGNIIIGGSTFGGVPMVNGYNSTFGGYTDIYVAKFNSSGNDLIWSTYLGGTEEEGVMGLEVDSQGNIYITGYTASENFPTVNAIDTTFNGDLCDGYVAKFCSDGDQLILSTYLGGAGRDYGSGIAFDLVENIYLTGYTESSNFPMKDAFQGHLGGSLDSFVMKIDPDYYTLIFSTYIGGFENDLAYDIVLNSNEDIIIVGKTDSSDYPLMNPLQKYYSGDMEAFVTQMDSDGQKMIFSTYIGGENDDTINAIALDAQNNMYLIGTTDSYNFPTINAYNDTLAEKSPGFPSDDVFVTKLVYDIDEPSVRSNTAENDYNKQSGSSIIFSITDEKSEIEQVLYNWDETSNLTLSGEYELTIPSEEGYHVLTLFAQDQAGNWAQEQFSFHTDNTAPIIASYGDIPNNETPGTFALMWTVGDDFLESYYVYANGTLVDFSFGINCTITDVLLPVEGVNLLSGIYNFTLVAFDSAGNSASNTQIIGITGISGFNTSSTPGFEVFPLLIALVIGITYRKGVYSNRKRK
jgi:hypothetical protein